MTKTYKIEQFLGRSWDQWPVRENESFTVILRSGATFQTNTARMEVSSAFWGFYKSYKLLVARPEHFILSAPISNGDIQDIQSRFVRDIHETYVGVGYCKEKVWRILEETIEALYNNTILEYGEYLVSYGSLEFGEIYRYPPIAKIRENIKNSPKSIVDAQKAVIEILRTDPELARSPLVIDLRTNNIKMEQFLQTVLTRGYNTEIDGHIYSKPIRGNYFQGITDPAEVLMESTLAAKALLHQGQPLEQTEYANRRIQISAAHVDFLINADCGSTVYADVELEGGLFTQMEGMNFKDGEVLRPLTDKDRHLIGTRVKMRLPQYCKFRDQQAVCEVCYGELAHSVPYGSNIGTIAATNSISQVSQRVLKVKHSEDSADVEEINISPAEREFIRLSEDGLQILLIKELVKRKITMRLDSVSRTKLLVASRLPILALKTVTKDNAPDLTEFDRVSFSVPDLDSTKRPIVYHVSVSRGSRRAYLTADFIKYMIRQGCSVGDDGYYEVDLSGWDFSKGAFELPRVHMDMRDFASEVVAFLQSSSSGTSSRNLGPMPRLNQYDDPTMALLDLSRLINSKVNVHITHISILVLMCMVDRDSQHDFRTPPLGVPTRFATYNELMTGRSLGAFFAYQGAAKELDSGIEQALNINRSQHLYDPMLVP